MDFGYQVSVKKSDAEVLHFGQKREALQPGGSLGQLQNLKTMVGALTNKGNSNVEKFYIQTLPGFISGDIERIPSK